MPTASILYHFATINDPRIDRQKKHQLQAIFFITLCAVISGTDNWVMIEQFGKAKESWFTEQLSLQHGIPSHDTFGDVFAAIDSEAFGQCFSRWVADLAQLRDEVIAIDGKTSRRSLDSASNKAAIHRVSAWTQRNRLVLGQVKVDEKSNEITAIPKLLRQLDIAGSVVTIDAMGCQKAIAEQIVRQGGDYVLSLKGNHGELHDDVRSWFEATATPANTWDVDAGHGRIEMRDLRSHSDIQWLRARHPAWKGLKSILALTSTREFNDKSETETRYFISSLDDQDPVRLAKAIRAHWGIENSLHWVWDVAFDEDRNRARKGQSAANLAIIRHIALNLIQQEKTKLSIRTKRAKAGWHHRYLLKMLGFI